MVLSDGRRGEGDVGRGLIARLNRDDTVHRVSRCVCGRRVQNRFIGVGVEECRELLIRVVREQVYDSRTKRRRGVDREREVGEHLCARSRIDCRRLATRERGHCENAASKTGVGCDREAGRECSGCDRDKREVARVIGDGKVESRESHGRLASWNLHRHGHGYGRACNVADAADLKDGIEPGRRGREADGNRWNVGHRDTSRYPSDADRVVALNQTVAADVADDRWVSQLIPR